MNTPQSSESDNTPLESMEIIESSLSGPAVEEMASPPPILVDKEPILRHHLRSRPVLQQRYFLAGGLFLATIASTFYVGTFIPGSGLISGITYSSAVMAILFFHEMGHYLQARRYHIHASVPYFLPLPISPLGTMGAVIVQAAGFANRKALYDIAISGPLAGLLLALPISYWGLSETQYVFFPKNAESISFGDPLIIQCMAEWILGPKPAGHEILLNPLLFAGWVGIFITALNLIPIGQLDGGHILYTLIGRKAHQVAIGLVIGAAIAMVVTDHYEYSVMLFLVFLMGAKHPPTANDSIELGWPRLILGWGTLSFIIVGFTPVILTVN